MLSSSSQRISAKLRILTFNCAVILTLFAHHVHTLENLNVIVINSNYNNSLVNSTNNFAPLIHGLIEGNANNNNGNSIPAHTSESATPTTTGNPNQSGNEIGLQENSKYFGCAFSPYVRSHAFRMNGYTNEDIRKMLMVIQTKCHSILTFEMGYYANPFFFGPYDATSPSKIATAAATINLQRNAPLLTVSQGAFVLTASASTRFPDVDAAFYSAQKANAIYPGTVSSITIFVQDPSGYRESVGLTQNTVYSGMLLLRQYRPQAQTMNLKLGVVVSFCEQILNPNSQNIGTRLLLELSLITDYIICEIYPSNSYYFYTGLEDDYYKSSNRNVKSVFEIVKSSFSRLAPTVEIVLMTGLYSFDGNFQQQNFGAHSPLKIMRYWDEIEKWSLESKQKVYMHQAFDTFEKPEIGYGERNVLNGYWKRGDDENIEVYIIKGTQEIVIV